MTENLDKELINAIIKNAINEGIFALDENGTFVFANDVGHQLCGYETGKLLGSPIQILIPDSYRNDFENYYTHIANLAENTFDSLGKNIEIARQNGELMPVNIQMGHIRFSRDIYYTLVIRDLTEKRKLEEQLRQSQKLEATGRLAGGVAHDYNNILATILLNLDFVREEVEDNKQVLEDLDQIENALNRGKNITKQLLAFSKTQDLDLEDLDIDEVITDFMKMLNRLIGEDVELELNLKSSGHLVHADRVQIEQVLMNLIINSRDAMPNGGRLNISSDISVITESLAEALDNIPPNTYVTVVIEDDGCGIDSENQKKIFEPFFTTKDEHQGTGLGLSTVYGIVKQMGGYIDFYSEVGKGTNFKIYLPCIRQSEKIKTKLATTSEIFSAEGDILLIEDEEDVRKSIRKILTRFGYGVQDVSTGQKAIELCKSGAKFSIVISDVILPDVTGPELVNKLKEFEPYVKILFISGYTDKIALEFEGTLNEQNFIQKPFTSSQLAEKLKAL